MFAIAVDGELVASQVKEQEVVKILRVAEREGGKVEVASFQSGDGWVPVCIERFHLN